MANFYDYLIIGGYRFSSLPTRMDPIRDSSYGVRRTSYPTVKGGRKIVTLGPPQETASSFAFRRKIVAQAFRLQWNAPDIVDSCLYDYLSTMYSTQSTGYLQFDDLMSSTIYGKVSRATPFGNNTRVWYTPVWPIKPAGWEPDNTLDWTGCVYVNGRPVPTSSFTVDESIGMIQFVGPLASTDVVSVLYTWRMHCQILDFQLMAHEGGIAGEQYEGMVTFEQVSLPSGFIDLDKGEYPCSTETFYPSSGASPYAVPCVAINATEYLTYDTNEVIPSVFDSEVSPLEFVSPLTSYPALSPATWTLFSPSPRVDGAFLSILV